MPRVGVRIHEGAGHGFHAGRNRAGIDGPDRARHHQRSAFEPARRRGQQRDQCRHGRGNSLGEKVGKLSDWLGSAREARVRGAFNDEERKSIPNNQSSDSRNAFARRSIRNGLSNNIHFSPRDPLPMAV